MKVVYTRCAGLDVHQKSVYATVCSGKGRKVESVSQVFGTFTKDLEELRQWLRQHRVRRVVIESTGVYWKPVWNVLCRTEWKFDFVLVNPQHVKAIPGRKTDQLDSERLAELGQYNLVRGSFVPPPQVQEWRDLTRRRVQLARERNRLVNRIARQLETANYKLSSVVSDVTGKTGWLILQELAKGDARPERLAELAQGSLQNKKADLERALRGYSSEHFRWMLRQLLAGVEEVDRRMNILDEQLRTAMAEHSETILRLAGMAGLDIVSAQAVLAELGPDMNAFPTAGGAARWAGLCPGQNESADKRKSGRTPKGNRYLRRVLVQCAWSIQHKKNCFFTALFQRIAVRRGVRRALVAVAHRMLVVIWHILREGTEYRELGGDYYDKRDPARAARRLTLRLQRLGFQVTLSKDPPVPADTPAPIRNGSTRWTAPAKPAAPQPQSRSARTPAPSSRISEAAPATPAICPRCAAWGIACIHARNRKKSQPPEPTCHSADKT